MSILDYVNLSPHFYLLGIKIIKRSLVFTSILLLLFVLSSATNNRIIKKWVITGRGQGTTYRIIYYAPEQIITSVQIDSLLSSLDSSISIYKPYSLITQFNNSVSGIKIDPYFKTVIKKASEVNKQTSGLVDITVKPLVDAWGFGSGSIVHYPSSKEINAIKIYIGGDKIFLKRDSLYKKHPKVQVDVNGIGQGYAVDLIAGMIEQKNISTYLVELGGEIRVKGKKPDSEGFHIGIASPENNDMKVVVIPTDGAITTSGNYERYRMMGNKKISHIINPITGYPVDNELISVTVWAKDALTADAFDNGFMAMGLEKSLHFLAQKKDMAAYFIYAKKDGSIADTASAQFWHHVKKVPE